MKTFISAVALATILTTPALANKTPVKPQVNECQVQEQLDQLAVLIKEMRADVLRQYPKGTKNVKK